MIVSSVEITLPRSEWEAIADRAMKVGDVTHARENAERKRVGSFPSASTPEAGEHWGVANFIRRTLTDASGDPITIGVAPAMVVTLRVYDYLPQGV